MSKIFIISTGLEGEGGVNKFVFLRQQVKWETMGVC